MAPDENHRRLKRHPIRVAADRSGLTPELLRAWESRYDVVEPGRSEGGQRRYSDTDIERLRLLKLATDAGRRISDVAGLTDAELDALVAEDREERFEPESADGAARATGERALAACIEAAEAYDGARLRSELHRAVIAMTPSDLVDHVISPLMRHLGEMWEEGRIDPGHEHLATAIVRQVLTGVTDLISPDGDRSLLVVATPAGELHEIGALLAGAAAAGEGWAVTYLGADLPAASIARAARQRRARVVALSLVLPASANAFLDELEALRDELDPDVELVVGGEGAVGSEESIQALGARVVADVGRLRDVLLELG